MANMNKMFKQMQKLQEDMARVQEELAEREVSHSAGGGVVMATVNGRQELVDIKIDPDSIDPEDLEMLEDMIIAAVNGALTESLKMAQEEMAKVAGLGGIPGLM
ncbi:MAG TPA: YbaB/EbfC family nucleoid-associated protein [candidate division Zixibacteria bacterium]|nr:YbaB/EbfC family nucleoid-associated protein [candidate division Zixibacteria bacterium]